MGEGYLTVQNLSVEPAAGPVLSPNTWPARNMGSACRRSSRAPSPSTPPTAPARTARAWAAGWKSIPDLLIPDPERSLNEGAIVALEWNGPREQGGYYWQTIEAVAHHYHIDLDTPVKDIPQEKLDKILYGTGGEEVAVRVEGRNGRETTFRTRLRRGDPQPDAPLPRDQLGIHPQQDCRIYDRPALPDLQRHAPAQGSPGGDG